MKIAATFTDGMEASIYMLPTVKVLELLCGLAFLSGRFVPLATIVIAPIIVNIVLADGFLAYYHRDAYTPLLKP